jgi:hypothetical protein
MPLLAPLLSLLLAADPAAADPFAPATPPPPAPPAQETAKETAPRRLIGFAAHLGASPGLFGAKIGAGIATRGEDRIERRWMVWLEADGTDWFRPSRPAEPGRVDRIFWAYPHVELSRELLRRIELSGWIEAGPTLGRYTVGGADTLWFGGFAAGAGVLVFPVRLGVIVFGQWATTTVAVAAPASPDVRMVPMVFVTAGLELDQPFSR